jgi:hypothetical protein
VTIPQAQARDALESIRAALKAGFRGTVAQLAAREGLKYATVFGVLRKLKDLGEADVVDEVQNTDEFGRSRGRSHVWARTEQLHARALTNLSAVQAALQHRTNNDAITTAWWPQCTAAARSGARA